MPPKPARSQFEAILFRPEDPGDESTWTFCLIPKEVSDTLPRRGRTSVEGLLNGHSFEATLEPDGQLGHWLRVSEELQEAVGAKVGGLVCIELSPVDEEPDPDLPDDLERALLARPDARRTWDSTTAVARVDWIHWVVSAKQTKTREKRIRDACEMLSEGKKRVCCFDSSGFYSKALKAPKPATNQNSE